MFQKKPETFQTLRLIPKILLKSILIFKLSLYFPFHSLVHCLHHCFIAKYLLHLLTFPGRTWCHRYDHNSQNEQEHSLHSWCVTVKIKKKKSNIAAPPNSRQCKEQLPPHPPPSPPSLLIEKLSAKGHTVAFISRKFNQDEYLPYPDWDQSQNYFQNSKTTAMKDVFTYLNRASFTKV